MATQSSTSTQSKKKSQATPENQESLNRRVIKKYPNRRLYDTSTSTYITLSEVKTLVMQGVLFVVLDAKTDQDLTRSILLQIILDEEAAGVPMFSEAMLSNIIRFYGHSMQSFMGSYLEKNIQNIMEMQAKLQPQVQQPIPGFTPDAWTKLMQQQTQAMMSAFGLK